MAGVPSITLEDIAKSIKKYPTKNGDFNFLISKEMWENILKEYQKFAEVSNKLNSKRKKNAYRRYFTQNIMKMQDNTKRWDEIKQKSPVTKELISDPEDNKKETSVFNALKRPSPMKIKKSILTIEKIYNTLPEDSNGNKIPELSDDIVKEIFRRHKRYKKIYRELVRNKDEYGSDYLKDFAQNIINIYETNINYDNWENVKNLSIESEENVIDPKTGETTAVRNILKRTRKMEIPTLGEIFDSMPTDKKGNKIPIISDDIMQKINDNKLFEGVIGEERVRQFAKNIISIHDLKRGDWNRVKELTINSHQKIWDPSHSNRKRQIVTILRRVNESQKSKGEILIEEILNQMIKNNFVDVFNKKLKNKDIAFNEKISDILMGETENNFKLSLQEIISLKQFDFYIRNQLLIEYDGEQHFKSIKHRGGEDKFCKNIESDFYKNLFAKKTSIPLLRIPYNFDPDKKSDIKKIKKFIKYFVLTGCVPDEIIDIYSKIADSKSCRIYEHEGKKINVDKMYVDNAVKKNREMRLHNGEKYIKYVRSCISRQEKKKNENIKAFEDADLNNKINLLKDKEIQKDILNNLQQMNPKAYSVLLDIAQNNDFQDKFNIKILSNAMEQLHKKIEENEKLKKEENEKLKKDEKYFGNSKNGIQKNKDPVK